MSGNDGEVIYEVRADDSKLESDLDEAQKKVTHSAEKSADAEKKVEDEKSNHIKKEQKSVTENHRKEKEKQEDTSKKSAKTFKELAKSIGDDIKDSISKGSEKASKAIETIRHPIKTVSSVAKEKTSAIKGHFKSAFSKAKEHAISGMEKTSTAILHPVESAKKAAASIKEHFTSAFSNIGKTAKNMMPGILAVGGAAAGIGVAAVKSAVSMDQAMNQFIASTGKGKEETERYQQVLEDIYANNYGESFEDIAGAMAQITKSLGDMDDSALQDVTESAFALRDTFEYDIQESVRAAKAMMDNFGTSGEEAMSLIAAGAQNGLDYSGELLDSISEYSVHFANLGMDADDMFQIFQKGAESGAFNLDKVGDAVKELSVRVRDGSDTTKEGFEKIGLNADEMAAKFAAGGDTAKQAFKDTVKALAGLEDPLEQNTAGVDLFGTMWEDLGADAVTALSEIQDGAYDASDAMEQIKDVKYDDIGSQLEELKRNVELLLIPLGESLLPVLSTLIESALPVLTELLTPLISIFSELIVPIVALVGTALTPLIAAFAQLVSTAIMPLVNVLQATLLPIFSGVLSSLMESATSVLGNIISVFQNLIDFIVNVFTGNWQGAWENVKNIFQGVVDALVGIFKAPINAIVDGWNSLSNSLGSISIPEWVPIVGGKSFSLPTLPKLRVGMDYVPSDDFPALLHKGEAVLTAKENARLRALGGLEGIEQLLSSGNSMWVNTSKSQDGVNKELIRAMLRLAKLADRPVAAYFNVDSRTMSKTLCKPMQTEINNDQQLKNMINGEK